MPTGGCARLAVGMWLLIALILGTVYRSNLKALLIIPKLELPFDSMEDLIKSGITTAVLAGTSVHMDVMLTSFVNIRCDVFQARTSEVLVNLFTITVVYETPKQEG
ncbi:hypothetical protein O3P69_014589 [Scylla paramamosain]|uniref:Ionotropic glutamate receptor C-terminal domain-containing protein n=1 Tax=Scylla paramamosain TaxID=85552 RepID=A0AAW0U1S9_SCYPA